MPLWLNVSEPSSSLSARGVETDFSHFALPPLGSGLLDKNNTKQNATKADI
jgi:hypothetical protein